MGIAKWVSFVTFQREILYSNRSVKVKKHNQTRGTHNKEVHTREGVTGEWGFQEGEAHTREGWYIRETTKQREGLIKH